MDIKRNHSKWCLTALIFLSALAVVAQDVVIRHNTTTTTNTTSTTTVSRKPQAEVVKPPTPTTGTLKITSTPSGAAVMIGGNYLGETPLTLEKQKPGTYSLTFVAEGYESQTRSVSVIAGKTATCSVKLKKQVPKPTTGTLEVTSTPSGAAVKIGGKYIGETPLILEKQKPATYSVTVSAEEYESQTRSVSVTAGKKVSCSVILTKKQPQQPIVEQPTQPVQQSVITPTSTSPAIQTFTANGVSFKMILVEGGTFTMGATSEQGSKAGHDEKPSHRVTLLAYYIGETEVTQELWQAVMGKNPSFFKGPNLPVEQVSWNDCQDFVRKLDSITGRKFRLPTEAEWEFAARGGNRSNGTEYSGGSSVDRVAWYDGNSGSKTHEVKTKSPNELGIYDMSGNVWEWCQDRKRKYSTSAQTNPTGPFSGSGRVRRGGSWNSAAGSSRAAYRGTSMPSYTGDNLGLRLACSSYP